MKQTIKNNSFGMKRFRTIFGILVTIFALFINNQAKAQTYYDMSSGNYSENFDDIANVTNWPNAFNGPSSTEWRGLAIELQPQLVLRL